jgi:hypothetical protein
MREINCLILMKHHWKIQEQKYQVRHKGTQYIPRIDLFKIFKNNWKKL